MNIIHRRTPLSRRTFLKGAGVSLALPWFEAMSVCGGSVATAGEMAATETPRRAVFCFFGLGINGRDFTPADTGLNYTLSPILKPLEAQGRFYRCLRVEAHLFRRPRRRSHVSDRDQHAQRRRQTANLLRPGAGRGGRPADAFPFVDTGHQTRHRLWRQSGSDPVVDGRRHSPAFREPPTRLVRSIVSARYGADPQAARSGVHPPGQRTRFVA